MQVQRRRACFGWLLWVMACAGCHGSDPPPSAPSATPTATATETEPAPIPTEKPAPTATAEPAPTAVDPPVASATVDAAPAASDAPTSPPASPVPPAFSTLTSLAVEQKQGGPAIRHCKFIVSEITIDLVQNTWTRGLCVPVRSNVAGDEPLTITRGKLTPDARARLAAAYGKIRIEVAKGCGVDGGVITLRLARAGRPVASYVDENWGCIKPPPVIAKGARDLAMMLPSVLTP